MALVADNLIETTPDGPRLIGGRAHDSGRIVFPFPDGADAALYERVHLKPTGALWSYTVQRFPPKHPPYLGVADPQAFEPFALGYVELDGEVIVETRIVTDAPDALSLGMPMTLTTVDIPRGAGGEPITTFAFRPA